MRYFKSHENAKQNGKCIRYLNNFNSQKKTLNNQCSKSRPTVLNLLKLMINKVCSRQFVPPIRFHLELYRDAFKCAKKPTLTHERPRNTESLDGLFSFGMFLPRNKTGHGKPPSDESQELRKINCKLGVRI